MLRAFGTWAASPTWRWNSGQVSRTKGPSKLHSPQSPTAQQPQVPELALQPEALRQPQARLRSLQHRSSRGVPARALERQRQRPLYSVQRPSTEPRRGCRSCCLSSAFCLQWWTLAQPLVQKLAKQATTCFSSRSLRPQQQLFFCSLCDAPAVCIFSSPPAARKCRFRKVSGIRSCFEHQLLIRLSVGMAPMYKHSMSWGLDAVLLHSHAESEA
mmetsp:Transcript_37191/g.59912  ORF Transcript_37191/g.59912 Transcript_37191/m.59912 type:complete len:214 (+) Transcript_37191:732-1373(+)